MHENEALISALHGGWEGGKIFRLPRQKKVIKQFHGQLFIAAYHFVKATEERWSREQEGYSAQNLL